MDAGKGFFISACFLLAFSLARGQTIVQKIGDLPTSNAESSGLLFLDGRLITHNDSGNEALLYELDTTSLEVVRTVALSGVNNTDWEDLAMDDTYLYVGDIGNNLGQRQDLVIWKIPIEDYRVSETVTAEPIRFSYEDQQDFSGGQNSDWDAEALMVRGDSLWIFTKRWQSGGTTLYRVPKIPGTHVAERVAALAVEGLVTAATPSTDGNGLALLGYSGQLQPFLMQVPVSPGTPPNLEDAVFEQLEMGFAQAEGIAAIDQDTYFICSETFSNPLVNLPAALFRLQVPGSGGEDPGGEDPGNGGEGPGGETPGGGGPVPGNGGGPTPGLAPDELRIFRSPGSPILQYAHGSDAVVLGRAIYDAAGRRIRFERGEEVRDPRVDISHLEQAVYYLTLYLRNLTLSRPFVTP